MYSNLHHIRIALLLVLLSNKTRTKSSSKYIKSPIDIHNLKATCNTINSNNNFEYLWRLDYIDSTINNKYICNNNAYKYKNIDIFILDPSIQSIHIGFNTINYYKFASNYNEQPSSEHGTHIAALMISKTVGITQGSLDIPMYCYPICRYKYGASSFRLIENASIKINTFTKGNNNKHVIIYLGIQTNGLLSQKWIDILNDLFEEIIELAGVIVSSVANENINACNIYPNCSPYVTSVSASTNDIKIFYNYGECVHFYAPGNDIYSGDLGISNMEYKRLKGTSIFAAIITGIIENQKINEGANDIQTTTTTLIDSEQIAMKGYEVLCSHIAGFNNDKLHFTLEQSKEWIYDVIYNGITQNNTLQLYILKSFLTTNIIFLSEIINDILADELNYILILLVSLQKHSCTLTNSGEKLADKNSENVLYSVTMRVWKLSMLFCLSCCFIQSSPMPHELMSRLKNIKNERMKLSEIWHNFLIDEYGLIDESVTYLVSFHTIFSLIGKCLSMEDGIDIKNNICNYDNDYQELLKSSTMFQWLGFINSSRKTLQVYCGTPLLYLNKENSIKFNTNSNTSISKSYSTLYVLFDSDE